MIECTVLFDKGETMDYFEKKGKEPVTIKEMLQETFPNQPVLVVYLESAFSVLGADREIAKAFLVFMKRVLIGRVFRFPIESSLIDRFDVRNDPKRFQALADHMATSRKLCDYSETVLYFSTYLVVKDVAQEQREDLAKLFVCTCAILVEVSDLI